MILNVLIVDDDMAVRTSLRNMIDWKNKGFIISNEAVNGKNAVALIEGSDTDIVITDMNMPVMDGVALIQYIERNHPEIKIIALSGYDDFNYVRESMKKGAIDYILKHKLNSKILLDVLETARKSILSGKREMDERIRTKARLDSAKEFLRHEFIYDLITGEITDMEKSKYNIRQLELDMDIKNLAVAAVEIDDYSFLTDSCKIKDLNKLIKTFLDISGTILGESGKAIIEHIEKGDFVIIFSFGNMASNMYIYNRVIADIDRIKTSIKRYLNITASFGISAVCCGLRDISKHYSDAKAVLKDKFYKGKDKIYNENNQAMNEMENGDYFTLDLTAEKEIIISIRALERENVHSCIERLFERIRKEKISYQYVQMITIELINIAGKTARESGIDISNFFSCKGIPYNILQKYDTFDDIRQWVLSIFDRLIDMIKENTPSQNYSEITQKAIKFIGHNYKSDISLNDVASYVGVTSPYLSHIFKEDTGKGFVEYLNTIRIEEAKFLIENSEITLKDMVKKLGFNSYNYFFRVFKEYIGMTPLEYGESRRVKPQ